MKYSLEQLMTFNQVAKSGSFSAAARVLQRSQSSVNMAMSNLEDDFNLRLFVRSPRKISLTTEGHTLLGYVKTIIEQCNALEQRASAFNTKTEDHVSLAIEVPYKTVSTVLYEFAMRFPEVDIHIREPFQGDVEAMVKKNEVDIGISMSRPVDSQFIEFIQLGKLIMVHVVSSDHPLSKQLPVSFLDLHRWRHITFGEQQKKIPTTEYLSSPLVWRVESYSSMIDATIAGLGWSSIPRIFVQRELEDGVLTELKQKEYPHTDWIVGVDLLWSRKKPAGRAMKWLINNLIQNKIFETDNSGNRTTI